MNTIKVGIVGPIERAKVWEQRLRPFASIKEVVISNQQEAVSDVDACIILENGKSSFTDALKAVRFGQHVFLVSRIPTERANVEKLYHAAEESNVILQFAHWATFSPSSQWMMNHIYKPKLIHIRKDIPRSAFLDYDAPFNQIWLEDLGLCIKWMNSSIHHVEANLIRLNNEEEIAIQIYMRFDSGSTAVIFVNTMSSESRHERFAANKDISVQCDVSTHSLRIAHTVPNSNHYFERKNLQGEEPADIAVKLFLKSIHLKTPSPFSGYEALQLVNIIQKINEQVVL
ncbi:MAG TPA: hypothetical protein VJ991_07645 [Balneolales bacterium]|nr:hypothetical protein [Balneolales bacterium]